VEGDAEAVEDRNEKEVEDADFDVVGEEVEEGEEDEINEDVKGEEEREDGRTFMMPTGQGAILHLETIMPREVAESLVPCINHAFHAKDYTVAFLRNLGGCGEYVKMLIAQTPKSDQTRKLAKTYLLRVLYLHLLLRFNEVMYETPRIEDIEVALQLSTGKKAALFLCDKYTSSSSTHVLRMVEV
jgi:hypothetical protein